MEAIQSSAAVHWPISIAMRSLRVVYVIMCPKSGAAGDNTV